MWRIDPYSLRLFLCVVDTGTIAAAAERFHISASAVSKRISDLESVMGAVLVDRSNKGVTPTAAGHELVATSRKILNELDCLPTQIREYSAGRRGYVRVLSNISAITQFLPDCLRQFSAAFPEVTVTIQCRAGVAVQNGVIANEADVGIYVPGVGELEGLRSEYFASDELVLVVPPGHALEGEAPVELADALRYSFVGVDPAAFFAQEILRAAQALGMPFRCSVQLTSYDAVASMVEAGVGIGLMPVALAQRYARFADIRFLRLNHPCARREYRVCTRSGGPLPAAVGAFFDHLARHAVSAADAPR